MFLSPFLFSLTLSPCTFPLRLFLQVFEINCTPPPYYCRIFFFIDLHFPLRPFRPISASFGAQTFISHWFLGGIDQGFQSTIRMAKLLFVSAVSFLFGQKFRETFFPSFSSGESQLWAR